MAASNTAVSSNNKKPQQCAHTQAKQHTHTESASQSSVEESAWDQVSGQSEKEKMMLGDQNTFYQLDAAHRTLSVHMWAEMVGKSYPAIWHVVNVPCQISKNPGLYL